MGWVYSLYYRETLCFFYLMVKDSILVENDRPSGMSIPLLSAKRLSYPF